MLYTVNLTLSGKLILTYQVTDFCVSANLHICGSWLVHNCTRYSGIAEPIFWLGRMQQPGRDIGRRTVVERSNCSQKEVEL